MMVGWQVIGTAPRDGTSILLYLPNERLKIDVGFFVVTETLRYGKSLGRVEFWSTHSEGHFRIGPVEPTHWMPLPEEPQQ